MKNDKHLSILFSRFLLLLLLTSSADYTKTSSDKLIWVGESYAAFTSLVHYNDTLYCAFRNANMHADLNGIDCGSVVIIKSANGEDWEPFLTYSKTGCDLRDPQLSITPSGELMLLTEKVKYEKGKAVTRNSCISFIKNEREYTSLQDVIFDVSQNWNWIWNIEWIDNVAYGFCYAPFFGMVRSTNGINFNLIESIDLARNPSEASVIKLKKKILLAIVRTDSVASLGLYHVNKKQWQWMDCEEMIDCPKIIAAKKKNILVAGRSYKEGLNTSLYRFNKKTKKLENFFRISGAKDCSYPGLVYNKGRLYVSYYKGNGKSSNIYMTILKL